jgi:hypothetical protein
LANSRIAHSRYSLRSTFNGPQTSGQRSFSAGASVLTQGLERRTEVSALFHSYPGSCWAGSGLRKSTIGFLLDATERRPHHHTLVVETTRTCQHSYHTGKSPRAWTNGPTSGVQRLIKLFVRRRAQLAEVYGVTQLQRQPCQPPFNAFCDFSTTTLTTTNTFRNTQNIQNFEYILFYTSVRHCKISYLEVLSVVRKYITS